MRPGWLLATGLGLGLGLGACQTGETGAPPPTAQPVAHGALEFVDAPAGSDVARAVLAEAAAHPGKHLVVYVGAPWCEPCRYFHEAAVAGQLDDRLGDLHVLAFDNDRDGDALAAAGYRSNMIPLFALPGADGRASGKQIAGSIKGPGATDQIAPRLRALVDGGP